MNNIIKKNIERITCVFTLFLLICHPIVNANIIWPGVDIATGIIQYYIIILNAIITFIFIRILEKDESLLKTFLTTIILMILLTLLGIIIIPICGLIVELPVSFLGIPTFSAFSWIIEYLAIVLFYSLLDSIVFKIIFDRKIKTAYLPSMVYNLITVGLAVLVAVFIN